MSRTLALPLLPALAIVGVLSPAWAQQDAAAPPDDSAPPVPSEPPRVSFSLRGGAEWIFPADLEDGAGEVSIARVGAGLDTSIRIADKSRLGINISERFSFYDFSDAMILSSGLDPIDDASETSLAVSFATQLNDRWSLFTSADVLASAESGADFGESLTYSGMVIASYAFNERLTVGGGVLARTRLEEDALVIPVAKVDWKINDKWTLGNTGGSSGTRATLSYQYSDAWRFFADAGYEGREFRLDDEGPIPAGIVRDQRVPIGLGAVFTPNRNLSVHIRGGAHFLQSLEFDDSAGDEITDTDIDPTGFISLMVSLRM